MKKAKIIFRADGDAQIGLGHVYRCLAVVAILKDHYECAFFIQEPDQPLKRKIEAEGVNFYSLPVSKDLIHESHNLPLLGNEIVVLDGYHFPSAYQKVIKSKGCTLVCIDDTADKHYVADAIINHNHSLNGKVYSASLYTKIYQGVKYSLISPVFFQSRIKKTIDSLDTAFICFGGSDYKNITTKAVIACLEAGVEKIKVVTGSAYPYLKEFSTQFQQCKKLFHAHNASSQQIASLVRQADFAICPASTISYEVATLGIAMITGYYAENQKFIAQFLSSEKCATSIGSFNNISEHELAYAITSLRGSANNHIKNQRRLFIDSSSHILNLFNKIAREGQVSVRLAQQTDLYLYFTWANDPTVRANALNQSTIKLKDHTRWFINKLNAKTSYLYVTEIEDQPIGQVRFDAISNGYEIDYSVAEEYRGQGLANIILSKSIKKLLESEEVGCLEALVYEQNVSSAKVFARLGFLVESKDKIRGKNYTLYRKCSQCT